MGRRFAGYFERSADACSLGRVMDDADWACRERVRGNLEHIRSCHHAEFPEG